MDNRNYTQRPFISGFGGYNPSNMVISIAEDPVRCAVLVLLVAIFFLMLLAGGICIWPYLFTCIEQAGGFDAATSLGRMVIAGGISTLVGALYSFYLCWFHEWRDANSFSFTKIFMLVYMVEVVLSFILIPCMQVDLLNVANPNTWTQVLSFLFHGMLGALLTMVPSLLVSLVGFILNRLWCMTHRL